MSDERPTPPRTDADAKAHSDLQREIRSERKFTLAEAIGRLAGPGAMKGASPVSRKQQAEARIQEYLCRHLTDAGGVFSEVLLRQVKDCDLLFNDLDQPLVALSTYVHQLLDSELRLKELVREADVEWGQVLGERPYFDKDNCPPAPDDPYTIDSVRATLTQLAARLAAGEA